MHKKMKFYYESNDKTTTGRLRRGVGKDADELVPALPEGTGSDGNDSGHAGAAATHREVDV